MLQFHSHLHGLLFFVFFFLKKRSQNLQRPMQWSGSPELLVPHIILRPRTPQVLRTRLQDLETGRLVNRAPGPPTILGVGELEKMGQKHPRYISASA